MGLFDSNMFKRKGAVITDSGTALGAFMVPEYYEGGMWIAGEDGDGYPDDQFSAEDVAEFSQVDEADVQHQTGWWARLSANGHSDVTDWMGPFRSKAEARDGIESAYDVDPDSGEDLTEDQLPAVVRRGNRIDTRLDGVRRGVKR